jgi:uncharacterized membrane protein
MVKVERSVVINMPVSQVFAYVATGYPRNIPQWQTDIQEWEQTSSGPMGEGTTIRSVRLARGKPAESTVRVTKFEKNTCLSFEAAGALPVKGTYLFEPDGDATKFTISMDVEPGGFGKLAGPIVGREFAKNVEADLERLKQIIESA